MSTPLSALTHRITLSQAKKMTALYSAKRAVLAAKPEAGIILPLSQTFNRQAFDDLLAQPGCKGIRLYYGMDEAQQLHAVFVSVNEKEEDILPLADTADGSIVEAGKTCPPDCDAVSLLNS